MLYELYIDGKKADLKKDVEICFNYTNVDTDKPEAQHGGYSKSVDLPGTEVNNNIFGQIYNLDRRIVFDNEKGSEIGAFFDPRKRTDYVLWFNGDIVDKGYLSLDSIKREKGDLTYSITLFSDLGDFFYNLMYDKETGEELTLGNLHYGFIDEDDNPIDEDGDYLLDWNKDYIYESWYRLNSSPIEDGDKSLYSCITAAPTYSGYYDDFDTSKVLVNYDSLPEGGTARQILDQASVDGFAQCKGWMMAEATREMDEWETRDLRAAWQRPAVKMSTIFDAISDPENNGGYEVQWDEEIKNSPYYKNTYLILNRVNFDLVDLHNETVYLGGDLNTPTKLGSLKTTKLYDVNQGSGATTFDLSGANSPKLKASFNSVIHYYMGEHQGDYLVSSYLLQSVYVAYVYGGQAVRLSAWKNGQMISKSLTYINATGTYNIPQGWGYKVPDWKEQMANKLGVDVEDIVVFTNQFTWVANDTFVWNKNLDIEIDLPAEDGVEIHLDTCWVYVSSNNNIGTSLATVRYGNVYIFGTSYESYSEIELKNNIDDFSGIMDDEKNETKSETRVPKSVLFAETESPYKYLVGFTRMIGAKYRYDLAEKKIYINKRENYYLPVGYKVDGYIDRGREFEIQPTLSEYKWYEYGFETPETYASQIYKRKNVWEYGLLKVDTGFYFNNESHNIFEDIPYTNAIPFKQKSIYYNIVNNVPSIIQSPTLDITAYKQVTSDEVSKNETKVRAYGSTHDLLPINDVAGEKICAFDSDNGAVDDLTNCLMFYVGKIVVPDNYQISDNIQIMQTLNEKPCYMFVSGGTNCYASINSTQKTNVCRVTKELPIFSKYRLNSEGVYTDSLDFVKPNYTFVGNDANYPTDICIYERFWKPFIEDIYDPDGNAVTAYMFLREKPDEAMRKFYLFDNSIWVISEITDYNVSSSAPTKIKFVKVYNTDNYTNNKEIIWNNKYDKIV